MFQGRNHKIVTDGVEEEEMRHFKCRMGRLY